MLYNKRISFPDYFILLLDLQLHNQIQANTFKLTVAGSLDFYISFAFYNDGFMVANFPAYIAVYLS